jgi:hypothetical protein
MSTEPDRVVFDETRAQHDLGFPDCRDDDAHEHRLPISTFRVGRWLDDEH